MNFRSSLITLICIFLLQNAIAQFRPVYKGTDSSDNITGTCFLSTSTGFVSFTKYIGFTQDSGHTYVQRFISTSNVNFNGYSVNLTFGFLPQGVVAFSTDSIIVYGSYGAEPSILLSADQGQTWTVVYHVPYNPNATNINNGFTDLQFPGNGNIGYAVQNEGVAMTTNRGQTWATIFNAANQSLCKLSFPSAGTGYVSGGAHVYKATNNGSVWTEVTPTGFPYAPNLNCVFFTSTTNGYVLEQGTSTIYRTTNGAGSWTLMNDPTLIPIQGSDLNFVNDSTGYAATPYAYQVYKTINYGKTWEPCSLRVPYQFLNYGMNTLFFQNAQTGWAGGNGEYLLLSTNGGPTLPKAYFKIDTNGLSVTDTVKLVDYSNTGYQYQWLRNDTLIGNSYNLNYTHALFRRSDTITLIVSNGTISDTLVKYVSFHPPVLIYNINPPGGATGSKDTLRGTGFTGATSVTFGGTPAASFSVLNDSLIIATVGNGSSGAIDVITPNGSGSIGGFVYAAPPITNLPTQVADSIVCKSAGISLSIQNTESGVEYRLLDSLGRSYGTVTGNGGQATLIAANISVTGNYYIKATRISTGISANFTNHIFLYVDHPLSAFKANKINIAVGEKVDYYQRAIGASSFQWVLNQDASTISSAQSSVLGVSYISPGQKTVELISISPNGCPDTALSNAVFVYAPGTPSNSCYVDNIDDSDSYSLSQSFNDVSPAPGDGFMICASGSQSKISGREGAAANLNSKSSSVYANYTSSGGLRWVDYVTQGTIGTSAVDDSGNVYIAGIINGASYFHFNNGDSLQIYDAAEKPIPAAAESNGFIIKLDPNGNYLWHAILFDSIPVYTGYTARGGQPTSMRVFGNRIMILGNSLSNLCYERNGVKKLLYNHPPSGVDGSPYNEFLLSIGTDGTVGWSTYIRNTTTNQYARFDNVVLDKQGNAFLAGVYEDAMSVLDAGGNTTSFKGTYATTHGFLLRFDPLGNLTWNVHLDNNFDFQTAPVNQVALDTSGNPYVIGTTSLYNAATQYVVVNNGDKSTVNMSLSGWFVAKFNPSGILQWSEGTNNPGNAGSGQSLAVKGNTVYAFGSYIGNTTTDYPAVVTSANGVVDSAMTTATEMFLAEFDTNGNLLRVNRSGANVGGHVYGSGVFPDSHGNIVYAGYTDNYNGGNLNFQFFGHPMTSNWATVYFGKLDSSICTIDTTSTVSAGASRNICAGDSVTLGGTPTRDSVNWTSNPAGFSSHLQNPVVKPSVTTTYYVTAKDPAGAVIQDSVVITVALGRNWAGINKTICVGNSDTLGVSQATDTTGNLFRWTSSSGGFASSLARPIVQPGNSTSYFVWVSDSTGCVNQDTVSVTVSPNNIPVFGTRDTAICAGNQISIGTADSSYSWTWTSQPTGLTSNSANPSVSPQTNTSYFSAIADSIGCLRGDTVVVTAKPVPATPTITVNPSNELVSSATSGNQWYVDTVLAIGGADSMNYKPSATGAFSVRVTQNGCESPFSTVFKFVVTAVASTPSDSSTVSISPNPVVGNVFYIHFQIPMVDQVHVEVIDINGRDCLNLTNVTNGAPIQLPALAKGVYMVRITTMDGKVRKTLKLLLN